jgi:hypothetical protein
MEDFILQLGALEAVLTRAEEQAPANEDALRDTLRDIDTRLARWVAVVEEGGNSATAAKAIKSLEDQRSAVEAQLRPRTARPAPAAVASRLEEWRRHLRGNVHAARAILSRVLDGRIKFEPTLDGGIEFVITSKFNLVLAGLVAERPAPAAGVYRGVGPPRARPAGRRGREGGAAYQWRPWRDSNPRSPP